MRVGDPVRILHPSKYGQTGTLVAWIETRTEFHLQHKPRQRRYAVVEYPNGKRQAWAADQLRPAVD